MPSTQCSLGVSTRKHLVRIIHSTDSLPEKSKASRVVTAIACRLQLVAFELERARASGHFGAELESILDKLWQHSQLLALAWCNSSSVQTGYALLSELAGLLQALEASVLRLPIKLANDSRCKPALDELQALLASMSHYQAECEDTRMHLEAALSELVDGCAPAYREHRAGPGSAASGNMTGATGTFSGQGAYASPGDVYASPMSGPESAGTTMCGAGCSSGRGDSGPGDDAAVLQRVRRAVCALELDVEMGEQGQDLDAELLQLRDQMRREMQRHQQRERERLRGPQQRGHSQQQQLRRQREQEGEEARAVVPAATTVARAGSRRVRDGPHGPEEAAHGKEPSQASQKQLGGQPVGLNDDAAGGRVARLYAARAVARRLAAQTLATLKEQQQQQQRQQVEAGTSVESAPKPVQLSASRRRRAHEGTGIRPSSVAGADGQVPGGVGVPQAASSDCAAGISCNGTADTSQRAQGSGGDSASALERQPCGEASGGGSAAASVAALRRLNRVTQLAGLWEAGRPVAQQAQAGAEAGPDPAGGQASDSDGDAEGAAAGVCRRRGAEELPHPPAARASPASPRALRWEQQPQPPQQPFAPPPWPLPPPLPPFPSLPPLPQQGPDAGRPPAAVANSPFLLLAMQGRRAPQAPPPPVLGRLLAPQEPQEAGEELPAPPAAAAACGAEGCDPDGVGAAAAAARVAPAAGLAAQVAVPQHRGAPAPLPLPDASVHLRAVGLPGLPAPVAPQWHLQGPLGPPGLGLGFGLPAAQGPGHAMAEGDGCGAAAGAGGGAGGCGPCAPAWPLLDLGPDVPAIDLRDISGWGACLGRGAFGCVYKAMYRNKPVAVKLLHGGSGLESRDLRCLRSEIRLLCRLRPHPAIITVLGAAACPPDGVALVSELMDCDLYDYIHRRRQNCVPLDEVLCIARAIASGLAELHPAVVHRDLKPANVLLRLTGHAGAGAGAGGAPGGGQGQAAVGAAGVERRLVVKIADFGLARHKRSQYLSTRERDAGTLKYMAPECIASGGQDEGEGGSGGVTEKCDIYSFGVLLYELITGREPWEGCHPLYAVCQVQSGATLPLPDDPSRCPPPLRRLVRRCWAGQHAARPSSRELLAELDALIAALQRGTLGEEGGAEGHAQQQQQQQPRECLESSEGTTAPAC